MLWKFQFKTSCHSKFHKSYIPRRSLPTTMSEQIPRSCKWRCSRFFNFFKISTGWACVQTFIYCGSNTWWNQWEKPLPLPCSPSHRSSQPQCILETLAASKNFSKVLKHIALPSNAEDTSEIPKTSIFHTLNSQIMLELYTLSAPESPVRAWMRWDHRKGMRQTVKHESIVWKNMFRIQVSHCPIMWVFMFTVLGTSAIMQFHSILCSIYLYSHGLDHSYLVTCTPHNPTSFPAACDQCKSEDPSILQVGSPCACKALQCWMAGQAHSKLLNHLGESRRMNQSPSWGGTVERCDRWWGYELLPVFFCFASG